MGPNDNESDLHTADHSLLGNLSENEVKQCAYCNFCSQCIATIPDCDCEYLASQLGVNIMQDTSLQSRCAISKLYCKLNAKFLCILVFAVFLMVITWTVESSISEEAVWFPSSKTCRSSVVRSRLAAKTGIIICLMERNAPNFSTKNQGVKYWEIFASFKDHAIRSHEICTNETIHYLDIDFGSPVKDAIHCQRFVNEDSVYGQLSSDKTTTQLMLWKTNDFHVILELYDKGKPMTSLMRADFDDALEICGSWADTRSWYFNCVGFPNFIASFEKLGSYTAPILTILGLIVFIACFFSVMCMKCGN